MRRSHRYSIINTLTCIILLVITTGCQLTQSAFARTASNTGATFAAASLTLLYAHQGKVTSAYARSAFANYESNVSGLDQQLPSQTSAPNSTTIRTLLHIYRAALPGIEHPCLENSCNWHVQLFLLHQASEAFLKAGGQ